MTEKSGDELTKTTEEGKIELKEEELNRVAGGGKQKDFLKVVLKEVIITST